MVKGVTIQPVKSSNVSGMGYDPGSFRFYVRWKTGKLSAYEGVSPDVASAVLSAPSAGQAVRSTLAPSYAHIYVQDE